VHYRYESLASHPWQTPLRTGYESRIQRRFLGVDTRLVRFAVLERASVFVLGGWSDATSVIVLAILIVLRRRYILWTDTPDISRNRRPTVSLARHFVLRFGFRAAHAIMGTGRPAIEALRRMGAPSDKLVNFPYWIELELSDTQPRRDAPRGSVLRFVSSGRVINSLKGHDIAIRSLAKVYRRNGSRDFEYLIAGTGPDLARIEALAMELRISDKVKCLGWVEPSQLTRLFLGSDVLIHPSPIHEPYGVAVIEAMAAGLVVLASDATGAGIDRIEHGVNGFIHVAGSESQLADQIAWLCNHPEEIATLKHRARLTAEEWPVSRGVETIKRLLLDSQ
jgi:glycosyltransferase involved in cell wall biosynthesis